MVGGETTILFSADSRTWEKADIAGSWNLNDVEWTGSEFLAVGQRGVMFASGNGIDWEMRNPGSLEAVVWDGSRFVAVSGRNVLESADGKQWTPLGLSDPDFTTSYGY